MNNMSRNPTWHGLKNGEMPSFPERIVETMLSRFGIDRPEDMEPWPFGPFDILARFCVDDHSYVLKGRHIEQRGERSLFETQYIQKELRMLNVPVAGFWSAPDGSTLIKGSDWKKDRALYYEIQEVLPGTFFPLGEETARRAGDCIAQFHQAGQKIDTFLLNKMYWIKDFTTRRYAHFKQLRDRIFSHVASSEIAMMDAMFERLTSASWRDTLTWRLIHGDMSCNNLLMGEKIWVVDLDEVGLGEVVDDLGHFLSEVEDNNPKVIEGVLHGYLDAGGVLNEADRQALVDGFVLRHLQNMDAPFGVQSLFDQCKFIQRL